MNELAKLFGGVEKIKIMRLFLHAGDKSMSADTIAEKTRCKEDVVKKELQLLSSIEFVIKHKTKVVTFTKKGQSSKEVVAYKLNTNFRYNTKLKELLFDFENLDPKIIQERLRPAGKSKLIITSGIFTGDNKSRLDILYVGEQIKKPAIEKVIKEIESEIGKELAYVTMDVEEYKYRIKMFDTFLRDVHNSKHKIVLDKINKN